MRVLSLGQEDPLEEGMVTHSSILAWRIPWTEEPGRLQTIGLQNQTRQETWHTRAGSHFQVCLNHLVAQLVKNLPAVRETWV